MSDVSKIKLPGDSTPRSVKDTKARTVQYSGTLASGSWAEDEGTYTYSFALASLACGSDGTVAPTIYWSSNHDEYNYITGAVATAGSGIVFTADQEPENDIGIIIQDTH